MELNTLPETYVACRTFGHAWDSKRVTADSTGITIELHCLRCATTRTDAVDKEQGVVIGRYYNYAAGYRSTGQGHIERKTYRFEFVSRALSVKKK